MLEKNISLFIEEQFPSNFRNDGALLVQFIKYYFEWMEEEGKVTDITRRIQDFNDPDTIPDDFIKFLRDEFMNDMPANLQVDQRMLLKNILGFYKARGTEASYRLLFRILFNTEINFYYPGDDILRASDGRWSVERYLNIGGIVDGMDATNLIEIRGGTSGARARVDRLEQTIEIGVLVNKLYLTNINGNFIANEIIFDNQSGVTFCSSTSELVTEPGKWIGTYGQLSSNKKLQDNFYYQEFSYEIQSSIDTLKYKKIVDDLVHPSGTMLFGKVLSEFEVSPILADLEVDGNAYLLLRDTVLLIDNTTLDLLEDRFIEFAYILDFNIQTTTGGGLVSVNDGQISDFGSSFTIADFGPTPISVIGTRRLMIGTGTSFASEIGQPIGNIVTVPATVSVADSDNLYFDGTETIEYSYSDRFMLLTEDYPYASMVLEPYTITRSAPPNNVFVSERVANTALNAGTVTVLNSTVTGTGTDFISTTTPGDIMLVVDTVNANTYAFVYSVDSDTQITLNENYKWTSAISSQYKVFPY